MLAVIKVLVVTGLVSLIGVLVVMFVVVDVRVKAFVVVGGWVRVLVFVGVGVVVLDVVVGDWCAFAFVCGGVVGSGVVVVVGGGAMFALMLSDSSLMESSVDSDEPELESNNVFVRVLHFDLCLIFCRSAGS